MEKLIITVALTGNVPTKKMNPNLPVTADEIGADVRRCHDAGAVLFHVHARDADQKPTLDINVYKENARRIKDLAPDVIVQLSTGARAGKDWEDRAKPLRLLPEMGSFTTGSNNLPGIVYENSPQFIEYLAKAYHETGVKPEIEVFETGMIANALFLRRRDTSRPRCISISYWVLPVRCPARSRTCSFCLRASLPTQHGAWLVLARRKLRFLRRRLPLAGMSGWGWRTTSSSRMGRRPQIRCWLKKSCESPERSAVRSQPQTKLGPCLRWTPIIRIGF